jgi:hypothetical protein
MRRFLGSNRSLLLTITIAASAISLVTLASSGALASGRQPSTPASSGSTQQPADDIPTLQKKLAECRQDVAFDRQAIDYAESLAALAKRKQIVVISAGNNGPLILTFADVRDAMILNYVTGRITKAELASRLHSFALTAAKTLKTLKGLIDKARDERDEDQNRCAKLAQELRDAQNGGGGGGGVTFSLQSGLTKMTNTHQSELTIDPSGMSAHLDNSKSGGAVWKIDYSWEVPRTITPGKSYTITLHDKILSVTPDQPLGDQINALAPDFAQAIQAHWPEKPDVSKTFTVPLAASQKDSGDIAITIGFVSSGVTYHYRK